MDAGLDHDSLKPLIEGRNGDPVGVARNRRHPACTVRRSIVARYNLGPDPSWHLCIVIAGLCTALSQAGLIQGGR